MGANRKAEAKKSYAGARFVHAPNFWSHCNRHQESTFTNARNERGFRGAGAQDRMATKQHQSDTQRPGHMLIRALCTRAARNLRGDGNTQQ